MFSAIDKYCDDYDDCSAFLEDHDGVSDCEEVASINANPAVQHSRKRKLETPSSASKMYADKRARIKRENWNVELSAALIAQVELHPVIWDVNSAGFRNKNLKDSAWTKVRTDGNLCHIEDAECRRKWQHLVSNNNKLATAYFKAVSGESANKKPDWVHWTAMEQTPHFTGTNKIKIQTKRLKPQT